MQQQILRCNRYQSKCLLLSSRTLREWQIGVALFAAGNVANFVSFGEPHVTALKQHEAGVLRCNTCMSGCMGIGQHMSGCRRTRMSPTSHCLIVWFDACHSAGYAAQSLLAAIGCIQFVSNVVFARFVLKEQVRIKAQGSTSMPGPWRQLPHACNEPDCLRSCCAWHSNNESNNGST